MDRRRFIAAGLGTAWAAAGCQPEGHGAASNPLELGDTSHIRGAMTGVQPERGHLLRDQLQRGADWPAPQRTFKTEVLIAGGGVAGLAAARALRLQGLDDFALLEMEDSAGGNSRCGMLGGVACPLGAHYLPLPGDDAPEVQDFLEELGLRQRVAGRWQYDERHLCHSPQERLFFQGEWQDGLLPVQGVEAQTLAQYQRFADLVEHQRTTSRWTLPVSNQPLALAKQALAAITFEAYLNQNGLSDAHLRWYLDYCCRDDYGAGIAIVSAWAGLHYFASRHGFHAPGAQVAEREGLLTWPEGNAWLTARLAKPLGERLHTARTVLRIAQTRHAVEMDVLNANSGEMERWHARRAVVALPIFLAARVVQDAPDFLRLAARRLVYAPWLVANIHVGQALHDRPGPAPCWDNVVYGTQGLGYVDASHQNLQTVPGATVLTHYRALADLPAAEGRRLLLQRPWAVWRDEVLAELAQAHPDLVRKTTSVELSRYGHAMAVPVPEAHGQIGHWPSQNKRGQLSKKERSDGGYPARQTAVWNRLSFAHSDWAGYSVFEEAFTAGHAAAGWRS
jgi:monoamine oxidase